MGEEGGKLLRKEEEEFDHNRGRVVIFLA